ncbi:MAG: sigma-54-dependent Fis family transcriptional regulator, partial [Myxococcaceae bacterium]|nr:sigma-54-dependent Fis family transcriptional regulator [Myxococcaceae bacterium]
PAPRHRTLHALREEWIAPHERRYLSELLDATGGDISAAARRAGVNRVTLYRLMRKHGLRLKKRAE